MASKVLRLEPVPSASDPGLLLRVVSAVSGGQRDWEQLAESLDISGPVAQTYLDAGVWLGLFTPGAEVQLTRRGMALAAATPRRRRRMLAAAIWLTPDAAALLRHAGHTWTVERVTAALRAEHPNLSPDRAARLAGSALGLLLPAVEFPHAARSPDTTQLTLPFEGEPAEPRRADPAPDHAPDDTLDALRAALLDQGELSLGRVAALAGAPAGPIADRLISGGLAARVAGGLVATPTLAGVRFGAFQAGDGPFLECLHVAGLGVAWPRSLGALSRGLAGANLALRRGREDPSAPPSCWDPVAVVHGGLLAPGEDPPRIIPDSLSLRLRALTVCPALAMLGALLLLDRRADGRLKIDEDAGALRWRRKAVGPLLDTFTRFARDQAWIPLVPTAADDRLSDGALVEAAVGLGLAKRAEGRLMLDEALFVRLQDDIEAGLVLEALAPLAARLQAWLERQHRGGGPPGLALFTYGTLMRGEQNDHHVGDRTRRPARARGRLWVMPQGYPALVPDSAGPDVQGELVEGLEVEQVARLDDFEGTARGLYHRAWIVVETDRGPVPAAAYVMGEAEVLRTGGRPVDLTDWRKRKARGVAPEAP